MNNSDFILAQEAAGQQRLVNSSLLPIKCKDWAKLEQWGVIRTNKTEGLFVECTLPDGWRKVAHKDHSMWSDLVDSQGLKRASIFYKAAFYDQDAFTNVNSQRFFISQVYRHESGEENGIQYQIKDAGTDQSVLTFDRGYYAVSKADLSCVGFCFKEQFWYSPNKDQAFTKSLPGDASDVISDDVFFEKYHWVKPRHDVIDAAEKIAINDAVIRCIQMNETSDW